jgi:hypothetical protein
MIIPAQTPARLSRGKAGFFRITLQSFALTLMRRCRDARCCAAGFAPAALSSRRARKWAQQKGGKKNPGRGSGREWVVRSFWLSQK